MEPGLVGRGAFVGHTVLPSIEKTRSPSVVAVLSGTGIGWLIGAIIAVLDRQFLLEQPTSPLVLAGCLLALSIGPGLPQRVVWLLTLTSSGVNRASRSANSPRDVRLLWVILATVCTLAGLATAAIPLSCAAGRAAYALALERFFWMPLPHGILIVLLTSAMTVIPLSLLACGLTCISQLTRADGRWSQAALPWVLLGAGTGLAISGGLVRSVLPLDASIALAALPFFAVAIVAVGRSNCDAQAGTTSDLPPSHSLAQNAWPRRLAFVLAAIQAMALVFWIQLLSAAEQVHLSTMSLTTLALWTTAAGIAMASRCSSSEPLGRTPGYVGVFAGICHLVAAAVVTERLDPVVLFSSVTLPGVAFFTGGWTIGLMHQIALSTTNDWPTHTAGPSATGAAILRRCAAWPAAALILIAVMNFVGIELSAMLALAGLAIVGGGIIFARSHRPPQPR